MKKFWCWSLLGLSSLVLLAQQPPARTNAQTAQPKASTGKPSSNSPGANARGINAPGVNAPNQDQVLKLLALLKVRDTIKITLDATRQQVRGNAEETFREKIPNPTAEQLNSLRAIVDDVFSEISSEDIIKDVVPVYQRHLTQEDVAALIAFYSSPVGQKILQEQSAMVRESMEATAAGQQQKMESLMAKLELRVQKFALDEQDKNAPAKK